MQHPSLQVIERFAQGSLSLAEAARWEQHFAACQECGQKLGQVGSNHFMQLIQQSSQHETQFKPPETTIDFPELPAEMRSHSRYAIQSKLGHGGMGMVYQATHRLMDRSVALKLVRSDLLATPLAITRFRREVQAAASLHHPHIVTAFDAEEIGGVHFLVMEYVDGRSLDDLIRQKGPLTPQQVITISKQIAQGLHHAHQLGMIHRDIKPSNVMITRPGKVKILDFGLARWLGRANDKPQITRTGSHLGTLMYAAPEQRKSAGEVDAKADLYSLGATMVFLLTGEPPPFKTEETEEQLDLPDGTSPDLRKLIEQLLQHDPANRPASARAVVDTLNSLTSSSDANIVNPNKGLRYALLAASALVVILMALLIENYLRGKPSPQPTALAQQPNINITPPATRPVSSTQPAATKPIPVASEWQSLLTFIQPERDAVAGTWTKGDEGLRVDAVRGGRIKIPVAVPAAYDLRISFTRMTGEHSIGAVMVHGGKQCTFELDAWEEHVAGFQNIDGQNILQNATGRRNHALTNGKRYTLLIEVRAGTMRAVLDEVEVTSYQGDGQNLGIDPRYWAMPRRDCLGLLAWDSETIFHSVEWRAR